MVFRTKETENVFLTHGWEYGFLCTRVRQVTWCFRDELFPDLPLPPFLHLFICVVLEFKAVAHLLLSLYPVSVSCQPVTGSFCAVILVICASLSDSLLRQIYAWLC